MTLALIVSPIRSWPLDQGNRARVLTLGQMLKARGYTVHFLLSELEGSPGAEDIRIMSRQWDLVQQVPYRHQRVQAYADAWASDDWYDPAVDAEIRNLSKMWRYDLCLVNYAWYSRAFDALPDDVIRIVDTHDAFGDRHKRLYAAGTTPAWYYTRPADEGRCLDRADIVLAIQDEEQAWFESLTSTPVRTVGHVVPALFFPPRTLHAEERLRAGYMASANPSNQQSIAALIQTWKQDPFLSAKVELHVAGPICGALDNPPRFVIRHGFVAEVQDFFMQTDFSVNPNIGGSGLKIKSVEALSYGHPLFATAEGMLGISPLQAPYVSADVPAMVANMSRALREDPKLEKARAWARVLFTRYRAQNITAFETVLTETLDHHRRRKAPAALLEGAAP